MGLFETGVLWLAAEVPRLFELISGVRHYIATSYSDSAAP
jgi:hypothetical protein